MKFFTRYTLFALSIFLALPLLAQPVNDVCSGAISLPAFDRVQTCENSADDGVTFTVGLTGATNVDA
ncbi:MAG: hypothetical protein AAFZ52_15465, partial [Bacteroidota bacterium]